MPLCVCINIYGAKGMVILGEHRTDDGFYHPIPLLERSPGSPEAVAGEAALAQTAWKLGCLEMDCRDLEVRTEHPALGSRMVFPNS